MIGDMHDPRKAAPAKRMGSSCWTAASLMRELGLGRARRDNKVLRRYGAVLETRPGWPLTKRDIELLIAVARAWAADKAERRRSLEEWLERHPEEAPHPGEGDS